MNFFERAPPADFPDKVLGEQERNFPDPPVPFSEKEYFKTGNFHARAGEPRARRFGETRAAFKENISVQWQGYRHCSDAGSRDRNCLRFRLVMNSFSNPELEIKRFAR